MLSLPDRRPALFAFALGLASATGFAPLHWSLVTLASVAALAWLVRRAETRRGALAQGYWFGAGHFIVGLNWIAGSFRYQDAMPVWLGWVAVAALSLYLAVYPALATGLAWVWARQNKAGFALVLAGAWIVTEWLRAVMFTGFAWNPLSASALSASAAPPALTLVGSYGASGLLMLMAALIAGGVEAIADAPGAARVTLAAKWALGLAGLASLLHLSNRIGATPMIATPGITARIVQPNIGQHEKYDETFNARNFAKLEAQTGRAGSTPRLILWPEAAVPDFIGETWPESERARTTLASLLGPDDVLLTGADKIFESRLPVGAGVSRQWIGAANSVFALDAKGQILWRYDKAHLVPYGEYLPMRPLLTAIGLSRLVPGDLDFWPGPGPRTLSAPGFGRIGLQICYEIIFAGEVIDRENRPDFIFNPSNDAWFGAWGTPQFVAQSRLRAIEEGLPVVRATPTGISAVINASGQILHTLPPHKEGFIETRLPPAHAPTLFARYGNSLALALAFVMALAGVALGRRAR